MIVPFKQLVSVDEIPRLSYDFLIAASQNRSSNCRQPIPLSGLVKPRTCLAMPVPQCMAVSARQGIMRYVALEKGLQGSDTHCGAFRLCQRGIFVLSFCQGCSLMLVKSPPTLRCESFLQAGGEEVVSPFVADAPASCLESSMSRSMTAELKHCKTSIWQGAAQTGEKAICLKRICDCCRTSTALASDTWI